MSILSVCSFFGRLSSGTDPAPSVSTVASELIFCTGVGSDVIVKKLGMSRYWCLCAASAIFCAAQICGTRIENPHFLGFVSGLTGCEICSLPPSIDQQLDPSLALTSFAVAYGFLFGVYPALVAQEFGINGLSQNWGCMTLAPVIFGQLFNLLYGSIYDHHSNILPDGHRDCPDGLNCYRSAYWVTFAASLAGVGLSLWSIRHEHVVKAKLRKSARDEGREA